MSFLFSPTLLDSSYSDESVHCRPLHSEDYDKGALDVLGQLTVTGPISRSQWLDQFYKLKSKGDYYIIAFESKSSGSIIGIGTVMIEHKFIHGCGSVGHIEDIVVDKAGRGKSLGKRIILQLQHICSVVGAYKVILDCSSDNVGFYEKCGLKTKEVQMVRYFPENDIPKKSSL